VICFLSRWEVGSGVGGSFWLLSGPGSDHSAPDLPWGCVYDACVACNGTLGISSTFPSLSLQPVALGYNLFEGRPQLTAWRERVEAFLGAELCQEAHSTILSILGQAAKKMLPVPPPEVHASMQLRIARIP
jgi:hypothetical protein